jgi:hypothetical protein
MSEFVYTVGDTDVDSSVVYEAYYNADDRKLAVVLDSGWGYVYSNVPRLVYDDLVGGPSAGRVYSTVVKRQYGPGEALGYVGYQDDGVFVNGYEAVDMNPVDAPRFDLSSDGSGTAKGLYVTERTKDSTVTLEAPEPTARRKHVVVFDSDGVERRHTLFTESVDSAVATVNEIADMLDLSFNVKEVTVSFE